MLSEEEKKAIRNLENLSEFGLSATLNQADLDKMKTVLNLVTKLEKEITKYKNMYEAEHEIHQKRNEQLDRKERGIEKAKQLLLEKDKRINDLEFVLFDMVMQFANRVKIKGSSYALDTMGLSTLELAFNELGFDEMYPVKKAEEKYKILEKRYYEN